MDTPRRGLATSFRLCARSCSRSRWALHLTSAAGFSAIGELQRLMETEQQTAGRGASSPPVLQIADGIFLQEGLGLLPPFLAALQREFGAAPEATDFEGNLAGALAAINSWVDERTHGLIPVAISALRPRTRLALANAVYLKAAWLTPFKPSATTPGTFHAAGGGTQTVPFMHEAETLSYARSRTWSAVELPYAGSTLSLLVVLPARGKRHELERAMSSALLAQIVRRLSRRPVTLALPRFHIADNLSLVRPLERLGISEAFSERADFSKMTAAPALKIGEVAHSADIRIAEEGTEAAAVTIVTIEPTSERRFTTQPVPFAANRPFLFFVRDTHSGSVLFEGHLADAAAAQR